MHEIDEHGSEAEMRPLSGSELDAVAGGVGGWAFAAHAPQAIPPSPCFTALALRTTSHIG